MKVGDRVFLYCPYCGVFGRKDVTQVIGNDERTLLGIIITCRECDGWWALAYREFVASEEEADA